MAVTATGEVVVTIRKKQLGDPMSSGCFFTDKIKGLPSATREAAMADFKARWLGPRTFKPML
jgi:hypothetical protein